MTASEIIETINKYSLTIRCLPKEKVTFYRWTFKDGDEDFIGDNISKKIVLSKGGTKLIRESKKTKYGGWFIVKYTPYNSNIVTFNLKTDKFFAPTLEEAVQLFLNSKDFNNIKDFYNE